MSTIIDSNFVGCLTIVFIVLKLTHVVAWSWIWVLSPIWISLAFVGLVLLVVMAFAIVLGIIKAVIE